MGEVYRARDDRLSRDVAVKVLPASVIADPDRLRRFEQEARAAGQINHPSIMAIYDVGTFEGTPYIVSEYIEGETLREVLDSGPLPAPRAIQLAIEIASGLSAAHAKGIVHRDLKPENLILLKDGRIKILDFGIAKLTRDGRGKVSDTGPTLANLTVTGQLLGTASYMAPEQIRDHGVDHRADLFTLGVILYEMVTGAQAFPGETIADRMSAILRADPPALPQELHAAYPGLWKVLRRCLEKQPDARIDSARDLALALDVVRESGGRGEHASAAPSSAGTEVAYQRLTFREGEITAARFAPDGQTVIYSAAWDGGRVEVYVARVEMPESRAVGIQSDLLSVASTSELAVRLDTMDAGGFIRFGTLGRVSMLGGVPRHVMDKVTFADWGPDGKSLAVIQDQKGSCQVEYPIGRTIHRSFGWMSHLRVSRDGRRIAVLHHPMLGSNEGDVLEIDLEGRARTVSTPWATAWGLAWSPGGTIWVSGQQLGSSPGIYEVTRDGTLRLRLRLTGGPYLQDISSSGDLLFIQQTPQMKMEWHEPGADPRDLSCLDWTLCRDISPDGKWILFDETGLVNGGQASAYMRATDGSPAVRLADGLAIEFSPDGQWVLANNGGDMVLLPIGAGREQPLPTSGLSVHDATWLPDGRALCLAAAESGRGLRLYVYDLASKSMRPISEEGVGVHLGRVSPDGKYVIARNPSTSYTLYSLEGEPHRPLEGVQPGERPHNWSAEGDAVFAFERGKIPSSIFRIEIATGKRELWHAIGPRNPSGVSGINSMLISRDGRSFAASYMREISELYIARGVH
jgi:Tol biopolymer transport system component